jgi:hypothetical protein
VGSSEQELMSDSIPKRRPTACTTRLHVVRVSETDVVLVEHRIVLDALRLNAVGAQALHERLERASIPHAEREVVDPDPALTEPIVARRPLERATGRMLVGARRFRWSGETSSLGRRTTHMRSTNTGPDTLVYASAATPAFRLDELYDSGDLASPGRS